MLKPDTKGVLANSVKELLKENLFTDIGVQDIVRYSRVSRTAFYNHFKDKYDLVCWIYRTDADQICKGFTGENWRKYHTRLLEYMLKERDYYINVSSYHGQNCIEDYVTDYAVECMESHLKRELGVCELSEEVMISLYMWNLTRTTVIFRWIRSKDNRSPKEITQLICGCIPEPISAFYH